MTLLLITSNFKMGLGGVSSYAYDLISTVGDVYDIIVITGDNGDFIPPKCKDVIKFNIKDLSTTNANRFIKLILKINPNIIINSNVGLFSLIVPYLNNNIKIISISHFVNGPLAWNAGLNSKYIDTIVALSSFGKEYLKNKFKIKDENKKIKVIPNFAENDSIISNNKKQRQVLNIVYPGGCSYQKSAEIVCHAILKLLNTDLQFNLYWIGGTKIAGAQIPIIRLKNITDILPNDNRIKHIGPVERNKAKEIIGNSNIFILPSRGEGFPISLVEAMSKSCIPIISDAKHGSLDIIKNGMNGLIIKQDSVNDLFESLISIIKEHTKYINIYDESIKTYTTFLSKERWRINMKKIFLDKNNHKHRVEIFNKKKYKKQAFFYTIKMKLFRYKELRNQLKHFLYFKFLFIKYRLL